MNNLEWFSQNDFSLRIQNRFAERLKEIYFCDFKVKSKMLKKIIPIAADDDVAPWTEPGPCLRWYGIVEGFHFQLISRLGSVETADVHIFLPDNKSIDWRVLKDGKIPAGFVRKLTWISGYEESKISIFCIDEENLIYEFYRAKDESEAEEFNDFLLESKFARRIFINESENSNAVWVVEREKNIVARYNSRYISEKYAVRESKENDLDYLVYCKNIPNIQTITFRKGKMVKGFTSK